MSRSTSVAPSPSATPRAVAEHLLDKEILPEVVLSEANAPRPLTVYRTLAGPAALLASDTAPTDSPGFVDALLSLSDGDDDHEGDHEDRYQTFAAIFETLADAERAFDAAVANHLSPDGWDLPATPGVWNSRRGYEPDPGLGDKSVQYVKGMDYGYPEISVFLWRDGNMLLQAVDFHPYDRPGLLKSIARAMDTRASQQ